MRRITIVSERRFALIAEISEALADANVNIQTINGETFENSAVLIITVDKYDQALHTIQGLSGMRAISEDAILLRLEDEPGALAKVARRFTTANIDIRSVRFMQRDDRHALVAVSTDRTQEALALVQDILVS
jgi:hypothetical protein